MKQVWKIFWLLLSWLPIMVWLNRLGFLLLMTGFLALLLDLKQLAFFQHFLSMVFILGFPCLTAPIAIRQLISNRRLSLLPYFHIKAGLALLLLVLATSCLLPMSYYSYEPEPLPLLGVVRIFAWLSVYCGIMQVMLTVKLWEPLRVWPLLALVIAVQLAGDTTATILLNDTVNAAMVALSVAGWCYAFYQLGHRSGFKAGPGSSLFSEASARNLPSWSCRLLNAKPETVAAFLVLGHPPSLVDRCVRSLNTVIILPLLYLALLALIGVAEGENRSDYLLIFLLLSAMSTAISAVAFGGVPVRCRQIWLRHGANREALWPFLEGNVLGNLVMQYSVLAVVATATVATDLLPALISLHYMTLAILLSLSYTYFGIAASIRNWPSLVPVLVQPGALVFCTAIAFYAFEKNRYGLLVQCELLLLLVSIALRFTALRGFASIDWRLVQMTGSRFRLGASK